MIAVTGATGHLGKLVIADLIARKVNPKDIVAIVRDKAKAESLVSLGVTLREADYNQPEKLEAAFTGVEKVLLISGNEVGQRVPQHTNVINAAVKAKVTFIAYTSILKAESSQMALAEEHLKTEELIRSSGLKFTFLRNGWYIENYTDHLANTLANGLAGAAGEGRVSAASRADYAAAAGAVLTSAQPREIYELAGKAFTLKELAAEISTASGKNVAYHDMPEAAFAALLTQVGLPAAFAQVLADSDTGLKRGDLFSESKDLENLISRPSSKLADVIRKSL